MTGYMQDADGNRLDKIKIRRGSYRHGLFRGLAVVCGRPNGQTLNTGNLSDGVNTSGNYRYMHPVLVNSSEIRLVYCNFYGGGAKTPNAITVRAAVEAPVISAVGNAGQTGYHSPVFFNGARSVTIDPGGFAVSDPIAATFAKGKLLYSRTYVSVATAGMKWPIDLYTIPANWEGSTLGAPASDLTDASSNIAATLGAGYGPVAIIGIPTTWTPNLALIGDSIMYGSGDSVPNGKGFGARALLAANVPYVQLAKPGEQIQDIATADPTSAWEMAGYYLRMQQISSATHAIEEYSRNDFASGQTLAQIQSNKIALWKALQQRGVGIFLTTAIAGTTSTDGWTTTTNQTIPAYESVRLAYNAWVRDGAPVNSTTLAAVATGTTGALRAGTAGHPILGYFETADAVETARNSGYWKTPVRTVTDAAITSGSGNLTSATAAFTSADVGREVAVVGAGAAGATLMTTIGTYTSATQVALTNAASTTVSAAKAGIGVYTVDGIHPAQDGHLAMAATIDTSKFV